MPKILIVEDDRDTAKVINKRLSMAGFETVEVHDAHAGIAALREDDIALLILDIMLPAGGGMSILQNLKLFSKGKVIPVVVLTGIRDSDYKEKLMNMGATAYIEKPYDPVELLDTIKKLIASGEGQG